jgi:hypothetical protein
MKHLKRGSASTGVDPKPMRIFNPILQAEKYDPPPHRESRKPRMCHSRPPTYPVAPVNKIRFLVLSLIGEVILPTSNIHSYDH